LQKEYEVVIAVENPLKEFPPVRTLGLPVIFYRGQLSYQVLPPEIRLNPTLRAKFKKWHDLKCNYDEHISTPKSGW
jgi:hypothetical protein